MKMWKVVTFGYAAILGTLPILFGTAAYLSARATLAFDSGDAFVGGVFIGLLATCICVIIADVLAAIALAFVTRELLSRKLPQTFT